MINVSASVETTAGADVLFAVVADLATYPRWLDIVGRAKVAEPASPSSTDPAWFVDLRAQLGPLRRSKRLRMERTVCEPDSMARFERRELDGRSHSDWILTATIEPLDEAVRLTMDLHYGGSLWLPALDRVLQQEIRRSSRRLVDLVESGRDV